MCSSAQNLTEDVSMHGLQILHAEHFHGFCWHAAYSNILFLAETYAIFIMKLLTTQTSLVCLNNAGSNKCI